MDEDAEMENEDVDGQRSCGSETSDWDNAVGGVRGREGGAGVQHYNNLEA